MKWVWGQATNDGPMMSSRCGHFFVSGRVQGVCFRLACREEAMRLGLTGWVRNLVDGRVEVTAEGEESQIEAFRAWLTHGPSGAHVLELAEKYLDREARHDAFEILR